MSFDESVNLSELARDWAKKIDQSEKKYDDFFALSKKRAMLTKLMPNPFRKT